MTDFRALCAELVDELEDWIAYGDDGDCADAHAVVDRARAALAQPEPQSSAMAWCRSDDFNDAAKKKQSFSGWREQHPDCDLALCVFPVTAQPKPQGPTDEELESFLVDVACQNGNMYHAEPMTLARAVLARWGRPTIEPVPVGERLPGPEDCTVNPRDGQGQWCWGWVQFYDEIPYSGKWRMMRRNCLIDEASVWLPHHALPVPQQEADRG